MKKLRLLLALFVASIGAVQSASARVAPTLPEAQAPADGQYYYLYNVMEGKFHDLYVKAEANIEIKDCNFSDILKER